MESRVLIASGRACDIYEHGDGRILRRYRQGEPCDPGREAAVMRRARSAGVPVPEVFEVQPDALVLERVDGPTMLEAIEKQPWRFLGYARELGRLHRSVLDVGLVHGDFHPLNVIFGPDGPVVIDWSNSSGGGDAAADVAFSQVILATSEADFHGWLERVARVARRRFVAAYLDGVGLRPPRELLAAGAERRLLDPHLRRCERAAVRAFLEELQPSTK